MLKSKPDESSSVTFVAMYGVGCTPMKEVFESVIEHLYDPPPHWGALTEKNAGSHEEQSSFVYPAHERPSEHRSIEAWDRLGHGALSTGWL